MNSKIINYIVIAISLCSLLISTIALTINTSNPKVISEKVISEVKSDIKSDIGRFKFIQKDTDTVPSSSHTLIFDTSTGELCTLNILPTSVNGDYIRTVSHNDFNSLKAEAASQRRELEKEMIREEVEKLRQRKR
ncbi:MAG: hypothetical protein IKC27_09205 [Kiritimatiellae bacterium]|nr:hypothetical protein [Kiritimatiellia bacterium]